MRFKVGDIVYNNKGYGLGKILEYGNKIYLVDFVESGIKRMRDNPEYLQKISTSDNLVEFLPKFKALMQEDEYIGLADVQKFLDVNYPKLKNLEYITKRSINQIVMTHNRNLATSKIKDKIKSKGYISAKESNLLSEKNKIDDKSFEDIIKQHNVEFMKNEVQKYPDVFVTKKKEPLNEEQNLAVVSDEDNCLVIAGAGCGKTSMILAKVNYLIHKGVNPKKILVLSYTKKTVEELTKKLEELNTGVKARTFHSLGCEITGKRYYDNITIGYILRKVLDANQKNTIEVKIKENKKEKIITIENINNIFGKIKKLFLDFIAINGDNKKDVTDISSNIVSVIEKYAIADYESQSLQSFSTLKSDYYASLKSQIEYYEEQNQSIRGERVKSLAEVKIANFLFMNSIDYKYEDVYRGKGEDLEANIQYRPDFHIKSGEKEVWLEHFGVTTDEQGNKHASWCSEEEKYLQQMEEKIQKYDIIYTTSDMLHDGTLLDEVEKKLKDKSIELNPISDDVVQEYLDKLLQMQKYQRLIDRVERAISLFGAQNKYKDIESWKNAVSKNVPFTKIKDFEDIFLIISNIYDIYKKTLKKAHSIDFNDMISEATDIVKSKEKADITSYDYILVDEYQDITNMRYEFVKAIKEANNAKVLAVGDDWQSIYGFNGSDISLFNDFPNLFDNVKELYITQTYRNPQQLLNVTQKFIEKNKAQKTKTLKLDKNYDEYPIDDEYPIKAILYHKSKKDTNNVQGCDTISSALARALDDILAKKKDDETVCIIGRYNVTTPKKYDIYKKTENEVHYIEIKNKIEDKKDTTYKICYQGKYFDFTTIHKAKGLEWDYTILLDGIFDENGKNSFPCALPDDYIVKPLLHHTNGSKDCTDSYPFSEERRMLYVALTRCRKKCYWLISEEKPTPFYEKEPELKPGIQVINDTLEEYCKKTGQQLCPLCHNGIVTKSEKNSIGCNNCNCSIYVHPSNNIIYVNHIKLSCGSSRAIVHNPNTKKWFIGCANWSKCSRKQECNEQFHRLDRYYESILKFVYPQASLEENIEELKEKLKPIS